MSPSRQTVTMTDQQPDRLSSAEIGKDAIQSTAEAAVSAVGEVAMIITRAVCEVATAIGDLATEVFEIQDASRKAAAEATHVPVDDDPSETG